MVLFTKLGGLHHFLIMADDEITVDNSTYFLAARPRLNGTGKANSLSTTEVAIGILCTCIALSTILVFLWKFLKQKQKSVITKLQSQLTGRTVEDVKSQTEMNTLSENGGLSIASSDSVVLLQQRNQSDSTKYTNVNDGPKVMLNQSFKLSHRKNKEDTYTNRTSQPLRKRISVRSTGYSLRDYKCYTELESIDVKDILLSLKDDRAAIRDRLARRKDALDKASRYLEDCVSILSGLKKSVKDAISKRRKSKGTKAIDRVRTVTVELNSKYAFPYNPGIRWGGRSDDSFDSLQCCLQGLRSHESTRGSLEELAVLRHGHRQDNESDIKQTCLVAKSASAIWDCQESVRLTKERMKELDNRHNIRLLHSPAARRNPSDRKKERQWKGHPKKHFISNPSKVYPEQTKPTIKSKAQTSKSANALAGRKRRGSSSVTARPLYPENKISGRVGMSVMKENQIQKSRPVGQDAT